jgi:hypothetical protein
MSRRAWASEAELAAHVVAWLQANGWDVYQEVLHHWLADIVAVKGDVVWVIESKMMFGLKVLEQAHRWLNYADRVSIATPSWGRKDGHEFGRLVCSKFGIGVVMAVGSYTQPRELVPAITTSSKDRTIRTALCPEQKTYAAAGTNRGHWTPFKAFAQKLSKLTAEKGRWTLRAASLHPELQDNYSNPASFRRHVPKLCQRGAIPKVMAHMLRGEWVLIADPLGTGKGVP